MGTRTQGWTVSFSTVNHVIHGDNSVSSQRNRLLDELRKKPVTTLGARRALDVTHPAARVQELRKAGHDIVTVRTHDFTSEGHSPRVAQCLLRKSEYVDDKHQLGQQ